MEASLAYWIDPAKGIAFLKYRAQPDFSEWSATVGRLLQDPGFSPRYGLVFDRRDIPRPVDTCYIKRMVHFLDTHWASANMGRCAVVVSDLGSYGMGRMAEQIAEHENHFRTFHTMDEAVQWLSTSVLVPAAS